MGRGLIRTRPLNTGVNGNVGKGVIGVARNPENGEGIGVEKTGPNGEGGNRLNRLKGPGVTPKPTPSRGKNPGKPPNEYDKGISSGR